MDRAAAAYRRFLVRWVDGVRRGARAVVLASVLFTVLSGGLVATHLGIDTDTTDMLSEDLPFRQRERALAAAFPQLESTLLVVVEAPTPDRADDAAAVLVDAMRAAPATFGSVFDPATDPFFRRNGLLYQDTGDLAALATRLAGAQPFLGTLWADPSLRGLAGLLEKALKTGAGGPLDLTPVLDALAQSAADPARRLSWRELMNGTAATAEDRRRLIVVRPALDYGSLAPAGRTVTAIRALAAGLPDHGVRVRLTGSVALEQEELQSVGEGMGVAGGLSLTLVVGLLWWGLRSGRTVVATLVTLVMGLVWTAGFAAVAIGTLNLISVAFAVLFIGLSVDFGIHFALRYREARAVGTGHADGLAAAAGGVGGALTLCAVTAAIGFYAFGPTAYRGLAELGLIAGTGMFIALFANLTVLPAFLTVWPPQGGVVDDGGDLHRWIVGHARAVVAAAVVLGVAAAAALPLARFDFDPLNLRDPGTESVSTLFELMATDHRIDPYAVAVLAPDLAAAEALGARLRALGVVRTTRSLADLVPGDQDEKLALIGEMGWFLGPSLSAPRRAAPSPAERAAARDALVAALAAHPLPAAARLRDAVAAVPAGALAALEGRLVGDAPARLAALRIALEAGPVGLDDLPAELRARMVTADGRARLEVHPAENLRDPAALRRFVAAVRAVAPDAAGAPVTILEAGVAVVEAFREAAGLAVAAIGLLLVVLLRSVRDVVVVAVPLVLAALLTTAASVVLGLPFNFANVIVLPLLFGLGVASGIHLVLRARESGVAGTSTPRAVVFSALTTIGSFGSIALSSHPGTASMGVLLTVAITMTLVATLGVLPALMAVWPGRGQGVRS